MAFTVSEIFSRSVTIEIKNDACYETEKPHRICLDGELFCESSRNVITIDGLEPDSDHLISADGEEYSIRTKEESFLLNVLSFGAVGDGVHDDTAMLQAAIAACPDKGCVYLPKGTYLSGPLFFKSCMTLWIDEGAVLLGHPDRAHYPVLPGMVRNLYDNQDELNIGSWEGNPLDSFASLITAIGVDGLDIIGRGTIDGNAQNSDWWVDPKRKRGAWRPNLIFLNNCRDVRMQGLELKNSPCWCVHPYFSDHLSFVDLSIYNPSDSPNTDGFDPESCSDVLLLGTRISVGDDCIAIKSGKLYMAKYHHRMTKNIIIRNCRLERGHGSVTVGSEVAGGVEGLHVSQCIFDGTDRGVRLKTRRGRGERSILTDLIFENIHMTGVMMPVTVNMFYFCDPDGHSEYVQSQDPAPVDYRTPHIGSIRVQDVVCDGVDASLVCVYGLPEAPVDELTIRNLRAAFLKEDERRPKCPIMMDGFPELSGRSFYLKNIKKLTLEDVEICGSADKEPELSGVGEQEIRRLEYR